MKISGFTIARDVIKYQYPILASIHSILPVCDEFIVNVGDSSDGTLDLIRSIKSPKIRIIENRWNMAHGPLVLSEQTNLALKECTGDWAFYLQSDEVIHEADLPKLKRSMQENLDKDVDALRFKWLHFYGSFHRYRIDAGWYQKQDRIIRNNGTVQSYGDAFGFERKDGKDLKRAHTGCFLYHYGWVHTNEIMAQRRKNAEAIGFVTLNEKEKKAQYEYGDLNRFPPYFGTHPAVMTGHIAEHTLSRDDLKEVVRRYWWHPARILGLRYKTSKRIKEKIL
jgi:glycosyltransferase involved in cell wall biosynthesis